MHGSKNITGMDDSGPKISIMKWHNRSAFENALKDNQSLSKNAFGFSGFISFCSKAIILS